MRSLMAMSAPSNRGVPFKLGALTAVAAAIYWLSTNLVWAGGGDDHTHGDAQIKSPVAAIVGDAPIRLPDGSVSVPKSIQRGWGLRTILVERADLSAAVEFNGRVIADPKTSGRVQTTQSGRVIAPQGGLPTIGQRVRQGEVLALIQPVVGSLERSAVAAELADLTGQIELAERRLNRARQLEGVIPAKEIEAAEVERDALKQRRDVLSQGLNGRESLLAPVSGVVGEVHAMAGEVIEAQKVVFEVVNPDRLAVEALAYEPGDIVGLRTGYAAVHGGSAQLSFVGAGRVLREQAIPLLFSVTKSDVPLAIGMPAKIVARTQKKINGFAVPQTAVVRNAAGEVVIWAKAGAERFVLRRVRVQPLDAQNVAVLSGLQQHDRVVVDGAALLSQVR